MADRYKSDLNHEREMLADLLGRRERLENKIARQLTRVAALAALSEEGEGVGEIMETELGGLTNACRVAFRAAGNRGLMPTEVRGALEQLRFPTRTHKNILASIHTVIRRLEEGREVQKMLHDKHDEQDDSVYRWVGPNYGASNSLANQMADSDRDRSRRKA